MPTSILGVQLDRIWRRRWLVVATVALFLVVGAVLALTATTQYSAKAALTVTSQTRAPEQDAVLAIGYADFFNDPNYQAQLRAKAQVPGDVTFEASTVAASPLIYVTATSTSSGGVREAAATMAVALRDTVNDAIRANRNTTIDSIRRPFDVIREGNGVIPQQALTQMEDRIAQINSDTTNQIAVLELNSGVASTPSQLPLTLGMALLAGLVVGCAVALALGSLSRRVDSAYDLAAQADLDVLTVLPMDANLRATRYGQLVNTLARKLPEGPKVVAVATPRRPPEPDTAARMLASRWGVRGARVRVMDSRELSPGAGPLTARQLRDLVDDEIVHVDVLLLVAPPVIDSPEAQLICSEADATVLLVEQSTTLTSEVRTAQHLIEQAGGRVIGAAFLTATTSGWTRLTRMFGRQTDVHAADSDPAADIDSGPLVRPSRSRQGFGAGNGYDDDGFGGGNGFGNGFPPAPPRDPRSSRVVRDMGAPIIPPADLDANRFRPHRIDDSELVETQRIDTTGLSAGAEHREPVPGPRLRSVAPPDDSPGDDAFGTASDSRIPTTHGGVRAARNTDVGETDSDDDDLNGYFDRLAAEQADDFRTESRADGDLAGTDSDSDTDTDDVEATHADDVAADAADTVIGADAELVAVDDELVAVDDELVAADDELAGADELVGDEHLSAADSESELDDEVTADDAGAEDIGADHSDTDHSDPGHSNTGHSNTDHSGTDHSDTHVDADGAGEIDHTDESDAAGHHDQPEIDPTPATVPFAAQTQRNRVRFSVASYDKRGGKSLLANSNRPSEPVHNEARNGGQNAAAPTKAAPTNAAPTTSAPVTSAPAQATPRSAAPTTSQRGSQASSGDAQGDEPSDTEARSGDVHADDERSDDQSAGSRSPRDRSPASSRS